MGDYNPIGGCSTHHRHKHRSDCDCGCRDGHRRLKRYYIVIDEGRHRHRHCD